MVKWKEGNLAIIQARMGSSRLPNKVLKDLCGKPALWHVINRVKKSKLIDEIIIATTIEKQDLQIVKFCADNDIRVFVGSESDVLDRYYQAARLFKPDNVIRITSDCPLIDYEIIDLIIKKHIEENNDYTSNTLVDSFPDGLDCEIMKYSVLERAWENACLQSEREHVTLYIKNGDFKKKNILCEEDRKNFRWTLDTEKDFLFNNYFQRNSHMDSYSRHCCFHHCHCHIHNHHYRNCHCCFLNFRYCFHYWSFR